MRKFVCAVIVTVFAVSVALAEDFRAMVTKIEDGKVTFKKAPTEKGGKFGDEATLPLATTAKISKGKASFNKEEKKLTVDAGDPLDKDAVKALMDKAGESKAKGAFAQISTDADGKKITEIRFMQFGGKKKKKDAN